MDKKIFEVPLYTDGNRISDFDNYIFGTKDANEQKNDSFGKALKRYTDEIGMSARTLARIVGISKSAINYYFSGERQVSFPKLIALCLALRLHPIRTEHLFKLTHYELHQTEPNYYTIKKYLSGCAYDKNFSLNAYMKELQDSKNFLSQNEIYIFGTENAFEQKNDSFGKALKRYANDGGVDIFHISEEIGVSQALISNYFKDKRQVSFNTLIALCLVLRLHTLRIQPLMNREEQ